MNLSFVTNNVLIRNCTIKKQILKMDWQCKSLYLEKNKVTFFKGNINNGVNKLTLLLNKMIVEALVDLCLFWIQGKQKVIDICKDNF
jgi:hypothetical protein